MIENYNRSLKLKNNLINADQRNSNYYNDYHNLSKHSFQNIADEKVPNYILNFIEIRRR